MQGHYKFSNQLIKSTLLTSLFTLLAITAGNAAEGAEPQSMSIIETIIHGGPMIIFIWLCIVATSVTMVTFMIQLFLITRKEELAPSALLQTLKASIDSGNYQEAWQICKANKAYIARVLGPALERLGRGKEAFEIALIEHGQREAQVYKTKNSYLSVIGVIAPMIGLLGTVIGMMGAFAVLGTSGVSDPRQLALRIGEVLMATASGLFLAIPAFIAYYYFRNVITNVVLYADDKLNRLTEDIPFEELSGIKIGESFEAGGSATSQSKSSHRVSMALSTNCPVCGGAIQPGQNPCPHCGATLDWS
ncbi:MAG: MotA/TolQ/ExbB proton channel family protein [Chthoniobacterales bacterium]|nr:MotA/TolQ/ExbB proton channel family protein [Chthoniobacterales bacterium]MCX7713409.1 MotA/TolQ/ExbB proton channel family protein [Chthoniobacterales bacterium]